MIIRGRAPVRLGLGGGGTDVSPYTEDYGGAVLNATINKYCWASLSFRKDSKVHLHSYDYNKTISFDSVHDIVPDGELSLMKAVIEDIYTGKKGLNMFLRSDVPPRSGLGGSATAFVAALGVFNHLKGARRLNIYEIAEKAFDLERNKLKIPGGRQDQYCATFGGFNFMEFKGKDFVRVAPLKLKRDIVLELEKNLILCRAPPREKTDDVLADQKKNVESGKSLESMHKTKETAFAMKRALLNEDLTEFGKLLHTAWEEKKKFSSLISNKKIDAIYKAALSKGAIGGKITGAGGGGHMLFYCKPDTEIEVKKALIEQGATPTNYSFDFNGLETWEVDE